MRVVFLSAKMLVREMDLRVSQWMRSLITISWKNSRVIVSKYSVAGKHFESAEEADGGKLAVEIDFKVM